MKIDVTPLEKAIDAMRRGITRSTTLPEDTRRFLRIGSPF